MRTRFDTGSRRSLAWLGLILLSVALWGAGCAHYEPFEPTPIDEIPDGPGVVHRSDGQVVHRRSWPVVATVRFGRGPRGAPTSDEPGYPSEPNSGENRSRGCEAGTGTAQETVCTSLSARN